ncbi:hypothetical protein [Leucobacter triazinivorans]|uniref:hypothetical protein n=1 Tax=Leucobacter triazinivorans TaxID=1784719 RepID=UPI0013EEBD01|nr:hypothetical protein [Leucobacter triazinivorans]
MAPASAAPEPAPTRQDWLGLAVLSIGLGLIVFDSRPTTSQNHASSRISRV